MATYTCTTKEHAALEAAACKLYGIPDYGRDCVGTGPKSKAWIAAHRDDVVTSGYAGKPTTEFPVTSDLQAKVAADESLAPAEKSALATACAKASEKPQPALEPKPVDDPKGETKRESS
jgi:hypothetical protein